MENPPSFSLPSPPPSTERDESTKKCVGFEIEPKTVSDKEMDLAREAALEVIKNHSEEEAMKIFLEGLVPATRTPARLKWEDVLIAKEDCEDDGNYVFDYDEEFDIVVIRT